MVRTRAGGDSSHEPPSKRTREVAEEDAISVIIMERDLLRSECDELRTQLSASQAYNETLKGLVRSVRRKLHDAYTQLKECKAFSSSSNSIT